MSPAIDGVELHPLREVEDPRGPVLHMLRRGAPGFGDCAEVYFSEVGAGVVKAWKLHRRMTQRLAVPAGRVRFALHDDRAGSATRGSTSEVVLGRPDRYALLIIPPQVWYGFQGLSEGTSLIANCADLPHDPGEIVRRGPDDISAPPFQW